RRTAPPARRRESGVLGLAERARSQPEHHILYSLPDSLFSLLPGLRHALLNRPLDEALQIVAEGVALALGRAVARIWIADLAPWTAGTSRAGGIELLPALRPRAQAMGTGHGAAQRIAPPSGAVATTDERSLADPLLEEVMATRRSVVVFDAVGHP